MKYYLFYFLIVLQGLMAEVSIDVKKDKESLYITDTLQVEITLNYPPETPPELFSFLYDINERSLPFFSILSSHVDEAKQKITFSLSPQQLGTLLFTPGTITFANTPYLVPGVSVECIATGLSTIPTADMLPLYPEKRIDLSALNKRRLMSPEILQRERLRNLFSYQQYHSAWTIVILVLVTIPAAMLFVWALVHFELLQRARRPFFPPPSIQETLYKEVLSSSLPLKERYSKLLQLIRIQQDAAEQEKILRSLTSIEAVCYAGQAPTEEEWQETLKVVLPKVKL